MKGSVPADKIAEAVQRLREGGSLPIEAVRKQEERLSSLHLAIRRALQPPSGESSPPG